MKKFFLLIFNITMLFLFSSCDFLSQDGDMAHVTIPLYTDSARAVGTGPDGTQITGFTVTVFGPGMEKIVKEVSPGAKYVNMYIPAGRNRYFTLEVHFILPDQSPYPYPHVHSFIGYATADLRPGYYTKLRFIMHAGATNLIVPDYLFNRLWVAGSLDEFSKNIYGSMGDTSLAPSDLDISPAGNIVVASGTRIVYGSSYDGGESTFYDLPSYQINAITFDKTRSYLYAARQVPAGATQTAYLLRFTDFPTTTAANSYTISLNYNGTDTLMSKINGMYVDPFSSHVYLAGTVQDPAIVGNNLPVLVEFDPDLYNSITKTNGLVLSYNASSDFRTLRDVIVKDDRVFVLNEVTIDDPPLPVLMSFDKNLQYKGGFGSVTDIASTNPGDFYYPKRFFAHENSGLYIIDDSAIWDGANQQYDKIIHINTGLESSSWHTYPAEQVQNQPTTESFDFFLQ